MENQQELTGEQETEADMAGKRGNQQELTGEEETEAEIMTGNLEKSDEIDRRTGNRG